MSSLLVISSQQQRKSTDKSCIFHLLVHRYRVASTVPFPSPLDPLAVGFFSIFSFMIIPHHSPFLLLPFLLLLAPVALAMPLPSSPSSCLELKTSFEREEGGKGRVHAHTLPGASYPQEYFCRREAPAFERPLFLGNQKSASTCSVFSKRLLEEVICLIRDQYAASSDRVAGLCPRACAVHTNLRAAIVEHARWLNECRFCRVRDYLPCKQTTTRVNYINDHSQ